MAANGHGIAAQEELGSAEQGQEFLLMGLRLEEGIDLNRYAAIAKKSLDDEAVSFLAEEGFIELFDSHRLRATLKGKRVLNSVIERLAQ